MKFTGCSLRCTVILAVTVSRTKLPAFLIFKGATDGWIERQLLDPALGYPQSIVYSVQPKAWVSNCAPHKQWIEKVWWPFCEQRGQNTYLINDEFKVHLMGDIARFTKEWGTEVEFIPGGYMGALQVLDKGMNKPKINFKASNSTCRSIMTRTQNPRGRT